MNNVPLSDLFHITKRFQRSVHLVRDFYTENALDGYVVTVKARETLTRLISAQENRATSKAWTLTGPYGSGKSAFALFAAKLLGDTSTPTTQHALELLRHSAPTLHERFRSTNGNREKASFGFCPVLISGERAPMTRALLQGLDSGLETFGFTLRHSLRKKIQELLEMEANSKLPEATEITDLFEFATFAIREKGGHGLLLVIDELGKFLEYAAEHPVHGDIFVLQTLAEFAARSDQTPLFLITILHQAFEQYANKTAKSQQEEWAKIQGRFEDIAFMEPAEQVLRLIGSAIQHKTEVPSTYIEPSLKPNHLSDEAEFQGLIRNCLPLHPTVALVLGPIFRRFAQNERSLFAFLNSNEPYGLQDFLANQSYNGHTLPMFTLADLYDYLYTAIGNRLSASHDGTKWIGIEMALNRLVDPSPTLVRLIKTIGLLNIIGEASSNLKASKHILKYALDDSTENFETGLKTLEKRSIALYRRYNDVYALWEGSDVDIQERLHAAENSLDPNERLMTHLSTLSPPRPLIARRHLFEKGTLRYFTVRYTDLENFDTVLKEPLNDADGLVLYALPASEHEASQFVEKAASSDVTELKNILIAIPYSIRFLRDAVTELACLQWVSENTPELEGDATARRELESRTIEAKRGVDDQLTKIFAGDTETPCKWFHVGVQVSINSQRARNEHLSKICDEVYQETPFIRNELINRRKISGAVTTARKKLIQAMLENGDQENLGITGYPAEMSIYRLLIQETGIHREVLGVWGFHPPKPDDKSRIMHTWNAIEAFLETCEGARQPIVQLYKNLMAPPLGVRSGPLPILLCAAMQHYKTEIALYENGSFIANWSMPVFERLLKAPEYFELKRFRMTGIRSDLFSQFSEVFNQSTETQNPDLLTAITPLIRAIAQLPKYTLGTQELSDIAKNLRTAVLNAREPDELLFKQLPEAFGYPTFDAEIATDKQHISRFANTLKKALSELEQAYEHLLDGTVEPMLAKAFNLPVNKDALRSELTRRAEPMLSLTMEADLRGFLTNICSSGHDSRRWLIAIASVLAQKPPDKWLDIDKTKFEINLSQMARKFQYFEAAAYELTPTAEEQSTEIEAEIRKVFEKFEIDDNIELHIALLARISQKWMQQLDE